MSNSYGTDGPARNTSTNVFANVFAAVKQAKDDVVDAVLEMKKTHEKRREMIAKFPYKPLSETDPHLPIDVQLHIATVRKQARDEVLAEQADLIREITHLRQQLFSLSGHRIQATYTSALQEKAVVTTTLDIDEEDTQERPAILLEKYEKAPDAMLYTFFIASVSAFRQKHKRRAKKARLSSFNASLLSDLIPRDMGIELIKDDGAGPYRLVLM